MDLLIDSTRVSAASVALVQRWSIGSKSALVFLLLASCLVAVFTLLEMLKMWAVPAGDETGQRIVDPVSSSMRAVNREDEGESSL